MNDIEVAETLKAISAKMDELSDSLAGKKNLSSRINGLTSTIREKGNNVSVAFGERRAKAEEKIKDSPFTYVSGAFFGGLALGYLMSRSRKN